MKIYYNPRCSKCREAMDIMEEEGIKPEIVEYLKEPPSQKEIKEILALLKIKAVDLVRKNEPLYKENYKDKKLTEAQWVKVLSENPQLIERPIVISGNEAIIGRPPTLILNLIH